VAGWLSPPELRILAAQAAGVTAERVRVDDHPGQVTLTIDADEETVRAAAETIRSAKPSNVRVVVKRSDIPEGEGPPLYKDDPPEPGKKVRRNG
jgi:hypothetical protein